MEQKTLPRLSSNALKLIALVCMTADHIGLLLYPHLHILRIIGRVAFPIFAYMIAEGCRYTSNRLRYFIIIFLLGAAMQAFFWITRRSVYQHVLITFSMSIVLIISIQNAKKRGGVWIVLSCLVFLAEAALCLFPEKLLPWRSFAIDYGLCGVLLPVLIYAGRDRTEKLLAAAAGLLALSLSMSSLQWWCLLSLPLLALYSGERGRLRLKYLFYIYYPLHLIVLEGIRLLRR